MRMVTARFLVRNTKRDPHYFIVAAVITPSGDMITQTISRLRCSAFMPSVS